MNGKNYYAWKIKIPSQQRTSDRFAQEERQICPKCGESIRFKAGNKFQCWECNYVGNRKELPNVDKL
jgi:tRNA(Ile2) C34 agmatinyltransferase TiaS